MRQPHQVSEGCGAALRRTTSRARARTVDFDKAISALLNGGVAGCLAKTLTAPLSRLTVLAQTSTLLDQTSLLSVHGANLHSATPRASFATCSIGRGLVDIINREGAAALWKGNFLTCLHRFPYTGIKFLVIESCWRHAPKVCSGSPFGLLLPGALAGGVAVVACYPLEVVRTRCMAGQGNSERLGACLKQILRQEGVTGMFRGVDMALAVTVPSVSISVCIYKALSDRLSDAPPMATSFLAGGLSGIAGSTLTFPMDVLRRRLQVMSMDPDLPRRGWVREAAHIWHTEGAPGFWRGLTPELAKVFPSVAITFMTFEWLRSQLFSR